MAVKTRALFLQHMATWSRTPIYILVLIDLAAHGHMVMGTYIYPCPH